MDKMRKAVILAPSMAVYNIQLQNTSVCSGQHNLRQVRSLKCTEKKKELKSGADPGQNLKLSILQIIFTILSSLLHIHPFVQGTYQFENKSPVIILHTSEQLLDLKSSCSSDQVNQ